MRITDRLEISDKRTTRDGYLVTEARFARSGIYDYAGRDVGKPEMRVVRVYRPEDEVFNAEAMASFAHRPITNDHPGEFVDAANWREYAVGFSDGKVARDGDFVVIPMMVTDAQSIADVEAGKAELSAGYDCDIEFIDGETGSGQKYDAIMRNIRGNHIAIVDRGRAGPEARIGDSKEPKTMKIMFDGIEIEATDQSAQAIKKLQDRLEEHKAAADKAAAEHASAIEGKDRELAAKDTEIADLKGKVLDGAALDKLVADRSNLVGQAKRLVADLDCAGKSAIDIKRAVVASKCGEGAVKDKSEAYIDARFDSLVEGLGGTDRVADAISTGSVRSAEMGLGSMSAADAAREEQKALDEANDLNGWRNKKQ